MNYRKLCSTLAGMILIITGSLNAQAPLQDALNSITADELRSHIYFLASDYMNGRIGPSAEYEIAAQYVATQFAAAGIQPVVKEEDGNMSYFQGVPFARTVYDDNINWSLRAGGAEKSLQHKMDFKIMYGNNLSHSNAEVVWVGYGIEEPDHKWNDFKNIDVEGKIILLMSGAPLKNGKPVLPILVHAKYVGPRGVQNRLSSLFSKGAAGIIVTDIDGSGGMPFDMMESRFTTETYVYKGGESGRRSRSIPAVYVVKPEFLNLVMGDNKFNPLNDQEDVLKRYKPQLLEGVSLTGEVEVLSEEIIITKNVVGMVPGTDPALKDEYIVVGAHLDHVKPVQGQVCNGADDNASGSAGVIEIAAAMAKCPGKRPVILITYTAEEMGLIGSRHFVGSGLFPKEHFKFNINMDMIGRSDPDNIESRGHHVVTHKKYQSELEKFINEINDGITDFPLHYNNDEDSPGGSDHQSFIREGIPGFFFFSGVHEDLHRPGDDPEKIDYPKAESISRLAFLIATKLANMEEVPDFE